MAGLGLHLWPCWVLLIIWSTTNWYRKDDIVFKFLIFEAVSNGISLITFNALIIISRLLRKCVFIPGSAYFLSCYYYWWCYAMISWCSLTPTSNMRLLSIRNPHICSSIFVILFVLMLETTWDHFDRNENWVHGNRQKTHPSQILLIPKTQNWSRDAKRNWQAYHHK